MNDNELFDLFIFLFILLKNVSGFFFFRELILFRLYSVFIFVLIIVLDLFSYIVVYCGGFVFLLGMCRRV